MSNVFKTERGIKVNPRQCPCCKTMFDVPKKVSRDGEMYDVIGVTESGSRGKELVICLLYTSPSPRDLSTWRMASSA